MTRVQSVIEGALRSPLLVTVAIGKVKEQVGRVQEEPKVGETRGIFQDYLVEVEEYVVKPLDRAELVVRIREAYVYPDGRVLGAKEPKLQVGLRALLFLSGKEGSGLAGEPLTILDHYVGVSQMVEDKVQYSLLMGSQSEPLDSALARIRAAYDATMRDRR